MRGRSKIAVAAVLLAAAASRPVPAQSPAETQIRPQAAAAPVVVETPSGFERITLTSKGGGGAKIEAYLRRPSSPASNALLPVVVMLHGCGGLFSARGALTRREIDWSDRFNSWGYAVVLVDSFNPRGFREVCTLKEQERRIRPADRAQDAAAAMAWIASSEALDKSRIAVVGWSHGGSTVLWSADRRLLIEGAEMKTAIAFYPGCRVMAESEAWAPRVPLTILMGDTDDWTRPEHCRTLANKHRSIRYVEYPGAVHGFDAPNSPRRTLKGLGIVGEAQVGTDPAARAAAIAEVERLLKQALQ